MKTIRATQNYLVLLCLANLPSIVNGLLPIKDAQTSRMSRKNATEVYTTTTDIRIDKPSRDMVPSLLTDTEGPATTQILWEAAYAHTTTQSIGEASDAHTTTQSIGEASEVYTSIQSKWEDSDTYTTTQSTGEASDTYTTTQNIGEASEVYFSTQSKWEDSDTYTATQSTGEASDTYTATQNTGEAPDTYTATQSTGEASEVYTSTQSKWEDSNTYTTTQSTGDASDIYTATQNTGEASEVYKTQNSGGYSTSQRTRNNTVVHTMMKILETASENYTTLQDIWNATEDLTIMPGFRKPKEDPNITQALRNTTEAHILTPRKQSTEEPNMKNSYETHAVILRIENNTGYTTSPTIRYMPETPTVIIRKQNTTEPNQRTDLQVHSLSPSILTTTDAYTKTSIKWNVTEAYNTSTVTKATTNPTEATPHNTMPYTYSTTEAVTISRIMQNTSSHSKYEEESSQVIMTESANASSNSLEANTQKETGLKDVQDSCGVKYQGSFLKTDLNFFFRMKDASAKKCLKSKILTELDVLNDTNGNNSNVSCSPLINETSFDLKYVQLKDEILWYPIIYCYNSTQCASVERFFEECNSYLATAAENASKNDLRDSLFFSLPWRHNFQNNTEEYSKTSVYLHVFNNTLHKHCTELIQKGKYLHLSNITIFSLNGPEDSKCREVLETFSFPSCYHKDNEFCFHAHQIPHIQRAIVFITNDTKALSEIVKKVYIIRSFTVLRDNPWCEHPQNYTTHSRILQNINRNYFYCYGTPKNTNITDSWTIERVSETYLLVAINGKLNTAIVPSNLMIQALISTGNMINTTIYNSIVKSNFALKHYTNKFNIPVFEGKQSGAKILQEMKLKHCKVETNEYFTKLTDERSIWSQLNWIILHNCLLGHKRDTKALFLFLSEGSNLKQICKPENAVLLTSIRREKISFITNTRFRNCSIESLDKDSSEQCQNLIKDGSDYETQFFHFLIYSKRLDTKSALQQMTQKCKKPNEVKIFQVDFEFNTHPEILGGFTYLNEINPSESEEKSQNLQSQSAIKTLQLFIIANLTNNSLCLKDIQHDKFVINIKKNQHLDPVYIIGPIETGVSSASCLQILPLDIYQDLKSINDEKWLRVNKFWPMCQYNMLIAWNVSGNIRGRGVPEWDYLSSYCKRLEITLFAVCSIITLTTITGNTIVITIIIASGLVKKHTFMLYMSLALSDLLIGVTSSLQALIDTYNLMNDHLTIYDFTEEGPLTSFDALAKEQHIGFQELRFERSGWPAFTGVALNISIMSSLMSLALLGLDRLLMLKNLSFENHHIKCGIVVTWAWNITFALLINIRDENWFTGSFDPITKLTLDIGDNKFSLSSVAFKIQLFMGGIAGIIIIIASFSSIAIYCFKESSNRQNAIMIHDKKRGEKIQVVTRTFLMMVILFLVSCGPIGHSIITKSLFAKSEANDTPTSPVGQFITWWLCMAGCSWNWVIYSFRGSYFREEAKKVWQKYFGCLQ